MLMGAQKRPEAITLLMAAQILNDRLFVISGNEWLPAYELARTLRRHTLKVSEALNRLTTARASTCYRLLDSLANIPSKGEPLLVLDLLHNFYDPDIPLRVRMHTLRECTRELERLAFQRPVVVMTQELAAPEYEQLMQILLPIADKIFRLEAQAEASQQPALF